MAIKRSLNWLSNWRVDLSHLRSIESASRSDFDDLFSGVFTNGASQIIKGLTISASLGDTVTNANLVVADSAILHSASDTSGTILTFPSTAAVEVLNPVTNPKIDGSFTQNSDNYIGLKLNRVVDPSTTDTVYFWDPSTSTEISKSIPLALVLDYEIVITNSVQPANILPIARIQTTGNVISQIEDRRNLLFRLGKAGTSTPNPAYSYPWAAGRNENPSTLTSGSLNPFVGGDKQLLSFKDWADAIMSIIKEIKGTTYWYSPAGAFGSITTLSEDATKSVVTGNGVVIHEQGSPGLMKWTDDIITKIVGSGFQFTILADNTTGVTLLDDECAYLSLQRGVDIAIQLTWTNGSAAVTGASSWTDELMAGDFVKLQSDPDSAYYQIQSVDSATQVTLTSNFSGVSGLYNSQFAYGTYASATTVIPSAPVSPTTTRRIQIDAREDVPFDQNSWWLFLREDNGGVDPYVYVRFNATQLAEGESSSISHGISQQTLTFIGALSDQDAAPNYSGAFPTINPTTGNITLANGISLTSALKVLDTESNQPLKMRANIPADQFINFENSLISAGDSANKVVPALGGSVFFGKSGSLNLGVTTPIPSGDVSLATTPTPSNGDYYVMGAYLDKAGVINVAFSAPQATALDLEDETLIGGLFPKGTLHIGYVFLQYVDGTDFWKSVTAGSNIIVNDDIYRFGAGSGTGSGDEGGRENDDLISMLFRGKINDNFEESSLSSDSTVNPTNTTASYVTNGQLYQLSYDASKTIDTGTTTTNILLNSPASYTVQVGDIVIYNGEARRITTVNAQDDFVTEAFSSTPTVAGQVTVSQAVTTKELYGFAGDGVSLSTTFGAATFQEFLIDYEDSSTVGDSIFDIASAPVVGWAASGDNSVWTNVGVRPTLQTSTAQTAFFPNGSFAAMYLRFFANKISGNGTVNLLRYRAYMQKDPTSAYGAQNSSIGYTDNSATAVNMSVSVVSGKTRIVLPYAYAVNVASGSPYGALDVYLNGQILPRFIAGSTAQAYYTEINQNIIDLDQDYSFTDAEILIVQRVTVTDTSTQNTTDIARLESLENPRNYIINGSMEFWQRVGTPATVTINTASAVNQYAADMHKYESQGSSVKNYSIATSTSVPTLTQSGFASNTSYQATMITGNAFAGGSDYILPFKHSIGLDNCLELLGKTVTFGFWIFANFTGTLGFALHDNDLVGANNYVTSFSITASNTWEYKTITVTLPQILGTLTTTSAALCIVIGACGNSASFSTTNVNTWYTPATNFQYFPTGATNWMGTNGNFIRIAQFSLVKGAYGLPANGFIRNGNLWESELRACQRYYEKSYILADAPGTVTITNLMAGIASVAKSAGLGGGHELNAMYFQVRKPSGPTMTIYSPSTGTSGQALDTATNANTPATLAVIGTNSVTVGVSGATAGASCRYHWTADAGL